MRVSIPPGPLIAAVLVFGGAACAPVPADEAAPPAAAGTPRDAAPYEISPELAASIGAAVRADELSGLDYSDQHEWLTREFEALRAVLGRPGLYQHLTGELERVTGALMQDALASVESCHQGESRLAELEDERQIAQREGTSELSIVIRESLASTPESEVVQRELATRRSTEETASEIEAVVCAHRLIAESLGRYDVEREMRHDVRRVFLESGYDIGEAGDLSRYIAAVASQSIE
jgi:hypothetical protein